MDNGAIKLKDKIKLRIELLENDPFLFMRDDLLLLREVFDELGNIKDKINAKIAERELLLSRPYGSFSPFECATWHIEIGVLKELLEEL